MQYCYIVCQSWIDDDHPRSWDCYITSEMSEGLPLLNQAHAWQLAGEQLLQNLERLSVLSV